MMRPNQKIKAGFLALLWGGLSLSAQAQKEFKYQAGIQKIDSSGFYRIVLQPALVAKSNASLSDIRLIDTKGNFVPYLTAVSMLRTNDLQFMMLPEAGFLHKNDTVTTFIVENSSEAPINQLIIKLKNTAVRRAANLSGSDDGHKWFAILENVWLQVADTNSDGTYLQTLTLPASNYRYFKISVNDKHKEPIKFLAAGIYTLASVPNKYLPIPGVSFVKKDSDKTTYITISLNDQYLVNRINLNITAPKFYKRDVSIYQIDKQNQELISTTELNSKYDEGFYLSAKTNKLQMQIANNDNLPLNITGITLWQTGQSVIAYLQAGQTYQLLTGYPHATAPEYDLKYFTDSIHAAIAELNHGKVVQNARYGTPPPPVAKRDYTIVIWVSIAVALGLLLFLTFKMLGEVKGRR